MRKKAQSAIEYLLILSGAIILAATVMSILMSASSPSKTAVNQTIIDRLCGDFSTEQACLTGDPDGEGACPEGSCAWENNICKGSGERGSACFGGSGESCRNNSDPQSLADGEHVLFVDKQNCNCSDEYIRAEALNPETPWCSLVGVREYRPGHKLQAGDTVYFRGGTYTYEIGADASSGEFNNTGSLQYRTPGTETEKITFTSYPGEKTVMRAGSKEYRSLMHIKEIEYWVLNSIDFIGNIETSEGTLYMPMLVAFYKSDNIEIKNCKFDDFQASPPHDIGYGLRCLESTCGDGWGSGLKFNIANNVLIDNCEIGCTASPEKMTIGTVSGDGFVCDYCNNITIQNSEFFDCGHDDIHPRHSADWIIQNNFFRNRFHNCVDFNDGKRIIVRNNIFWNWDSIPASSSLRGNAIEVLHSSDNQIYNNLIFNGQNAASAIAIGTTIEDACQGGETGSCCPTGYSCECNNNEVYNNMIFSSGTAGISLGHYGNSNDSGAANKIANNKIYNNIVFGTTNVSSSIRSELRLGFKGDYDNFLANNAYGNEFKNNLLLSFQSTGQVVKYMEMFAIEKNFTAEEFNLEPYAENNIGSESIVDPGTIFANPGLGENADFHHRAGSPAIDSGICLPLVTEDFDGNPRIENCDIGPFEFQG